MISSEGTSPVATLLRRLEGAFTGVRRRQQLAAYGRRRSVYQEDLSLTGAASLFPDPNDLYAYMHHYFHHLCPRRVHEHRRYYSQSQRGFGEDAFHAMWYLLIREMKPVRALEIGIYRGQVISLWSLVSGLLGVPMEVYGISPFTPVGDSVSRYASRIDYRTDVLDSFAHFGLRPPTLVKALSADPEAKACIAGEAWDLIYVDGGHDYPTALADYRLCRDHLAPGGILVLDDASLGTAFRPPLFSFAGHPGPSAVARQHADRELTLLCAVGHNNIYRKG